MEPDIEHPFPFQAQPKQSDGHLKVHHEKRDKDIVPATVQPPKPPPPPPPPPPPEKKP